MTGQHRYTNAELLAERYGDTVPWRELNAQPSPLVRPRIIRTVEPIRVVAARQHALLEAMDDWKPSRRAAA